MKKYLSIFIAIVLVISIFAGCSKGKEKKDVEPVTVPHSVSEVPVERVAAKTIEPASSFAGGDGTENSPFEISSAGELQLLADLFSKDATHDNLKIYEKAYYILTDDIEINTADEMATADKKAPTYKWMLLVDIARKALKDLILVVFLTVKDIR